MKVGDPAPCVLRTSIASGGPLLSFGEHLRTCEQDCRRLEIFLRDSRSISEMAVSSSGCFESLAFDAAGEGVASESQVAVISISKLPSKVGNSPRKTRMSRGASIPMRTVLPLSFRIEIVMLS